VQSWCFPCNPRRKLNNRCILDKLRNQRSFWINLSASRFSILAPSQTKFRVLSPSRWYSNMPVKKWSRRCEIKIGMIVLTNPIQWTGIKLDNIIDKTVKKCIPAPSWVRNTSHPYAHLPKSQITLLPQFHPWAPGLRLKAGRDQKSADRGGDLMMPLALGTSPPSTHSAEHSLPPLLSLKTSAWSSAIVNSREDTRGCQHPVYVLLRSTCDKRWRA